MSTVQFNTEEVQGYISRGWLDAQDKLKNPKLSDKEKPQLYKSSDNSGAGSSNKWDVKGSTMASQKDFLAELRRQVGE
ncbi:hypothetical protein LPJ53_005326 [Coemansia erecta]|uniref:Uncharacterized protein n=1 Tax=Coemansia erecta TaxID=147472 RepID=A0A9W7XVX6_9FUNG|nr:hypothetical protein LPJ53_005326 [Coemansia erecta]